MRLFRASFLFSHAARNQQILGEAGLVLTLESFFNSVKQGTNLKWNFDVLLRALKTTDNLSMGLADLTKL